MLLCVLREAGLGLGVEPGLVRLLYRTSGLLSAQIWREVAHLSSSTLPHISSVTTVLYFEAKFRSVTGLFPGTVTGRFR